MDRISQIKQKLDKGKQPIFLTEDELQYVKRPIGNAHLQNQTMLEEDEVVDDKYMLCDICGKKYTKYNKTKHRRTKHHQFCLKLNKRWRSMLLDE